MRLTTRSAAVVLLCVFAFGAVAGAKTVVISFERKQGFPAPGQKFTGKGAPIGVVTAWSAGAPAGAVWFTDDGPGGVMFPDAPPPISGKQIAGFGQGGAGLYVAGMKLRTEAGLGLVSFYWAWRGNGDTRPGGNAWLEAEYFDVNGKSVGKDRFTGGLNPDWSPKFELAKPSVQGGALSRVVFRGVPPDPAIGHGTFFLDDVTLSVRPNPTAPFKPVSAVPVSAFRKLDTTPPVVNLLSPAPDSTAALAAEISAKFADAGSGIDLSSARILLDGRDLTRRARVTADGIRLRPAKALEKGIHRVEIIVSDKAGNRSNRAVWRFGAGEPVQVKVLFEDGVFKVSGEPYFPIGIYNGSCDPYGKEARKKPFLAQACAAGVNCQLVGESTGPKELDIMLKHGMKGMKAVSYALAHITEADTSMLGAHGKALGDHPGLLAWWASDPDTMDAAQKNIGLAYRTLKETDPNHPVIWILSHSNKYKENLRSADACFTYFYPVLQGNMTITSMIRKSLKPAFDAAGPVGKQVWYASQAIDLRICDGQRLASPDEFRPTPAEIRAMNYLAVAQGVKGLFFYAAGGSPTPGVYNDLTEYPAQWKELLRNRRRAASPVAHSRNGRPIQDSAGRARGNTLPGTGARRDASPDCCQRGHRAHNRGVALHEACPACRAL